MHRTTKLGLLILFSVLILVLIASPLLGCGGPCSPTSRCYVQGKEAGLKEGKEAGYKEGLRDGRDAGYKEGLAEGRRLAEQECTAKMQAEYQRGYDAGKQTCQGDYQSGYNAGCSACRGTGCPQCPYYPPTSCYDWCKARCPTCVIVP